MYATQQRYWSDHPRVDQLVAAYLGVKQRKTPPPGKVVPSKLNWALLDMPDARKAPRKR